MNAGMAWLRRARPLLGTLVEIGVRGDSAGQQASIDAALAAVSSAQAALSRFDANSDVSRFARLPRGGRITVQLVTRRVLEAAAELHAASAGAFDISLGSAPDGWVLEGDVLHKLHAATTLDLGGIGKGYAVDLAVQVLVAQGCGSGWVNAGGDLRAFGAAEVPIQLRDESTGGVRAFATLHDGAFATSRFGPGSRSTLAAGARARADTDAEADAFARAHAHAHAHAHASVAAPLCLWADALTKVVALGGDTAHPALARLLGRYGAQAWLH